MAVRVEENQNNEWMDCVKDEMVRKWKEVIAEMTRNKEVWMKKTYYENDDDE